MRTGPCVIGATQLQAHRNYPCCLLSPPILACSPRRLSSGAHGRVPNDGDTIWPQGSRKRKSVSAQEEGHFADLAGIVTSSLLLFKCRPTLSCSEAFTCRHPIIPPPLPPIRHCSGSTARSPPSRSIGRPPSTPSIFRS